MHRIAQPTWSSRKSKNRWAASALAIGWPRVDVLTAQHRVDDRTDDVLPLATTSVGF
jgi:hypothetical protein